MLMVWRRIIPSATLRRTMLLTLAPAVLALAAFLGVAFVVLPAAVVVLVALRLGERGPATPPAVVAGLAWVPAVALAFALPSLEFGFGRGSGLREGTAVWAGLLLLTLALLARTPARWAGWVAAAGAAVAAWAGVTAMAALHGFDSGRDGSWLLWYPASVIWAVEIDLGRLDGSVTSSNFDLTDALELLPAALTLIGMFAAGYVAGVRRQVSARSLNRT